MGNLAAVFERARKEKRIAFMPYLTAGYPSLEETVLLAGRLRAAGADVVEIGIPFSDPLADGPTIQFSSQAALRGGATPVKVIEMLAELKKIFSGGAVVVMTYANPVFHAGIEEFSSMLRDAGCDGVIVPDLPPDEGAAFYRACRLKGVATVMLAAPTSPDERLRFVAEESEGFVYCVSLAGVTGVRDKLSDLAVPFLERMRSLTDKPLALGFGVSRPEHVAAVRNVADGVIVGSALVEAIRRGVEEGVRGESLADALADFVAPFVDAAKA